MFPITFKRKEIRDFIQDHAAFHFVACQKLPGLESEEENVTKCSVNELNYITSQIDLHQWCLLNNAKKKKKKSHDPTQHDTMSHYQIFFYLVFWLRDL